MINKLYSSRSSEETLNELYHWTKMEYAVLGRIAIALSVQQTGRKLKFNNDETGKEFNRYSLTGSNDLLFKSTIALVHLNPISDEEYFSRYLKSHLDDGCSILSKLWKESESNVDDFLLKVSSHIPVELGKAYKGRVPILEIEVGQELLTNERVHLRLNDTSKHANSHLAIMGKPGVGKTQCLLKILADIRNHSDFETNFIYFDYKGDVGSNHAFIDSTKAEVFALPKDTLPINPFILQEYDPKSVKFSAEEKAESFASFERGLGPLQKGNLSRAIEKAYENRRLMGDTSYPDFFDVNNEIRAIYDEDKEDKLTEIMRRLTEFGLFWDHRSPQQLFDNLHDKTFIVDLSKLPALKELVAYLIIERFYREMSALPDSEVGEDVYREIRSILVIDEAHNYLSQKNPFLEKIVREGRSKGVVTFFASQSPNDYNQSGFDFQELLEFILVFQCEGVSLSSIQKLLGRSSGIAKDLQQEISRLKPWQVITKPSVGMRSNFLAFEATPFYKSYK